MIRKNVQKICSGSLETIENYQEAIKSKNFYHLHHRLETSKGLPRQFLIEHNLYYNRPAEELIFLESGVHSRLHSLCKKGYSEEEAYEIIDLEKRLTPELVYRLHEEDCMPIYKIAKEYNTTSKTVQKRLEKFYKENNINNPSESNSFDFDPLALTSPEELFDWYIIKKYDINRISYLLNLDEANIKKLLHLWKIDDQMNWSNPQRWTTPEVHYTISKNPISIDRPDFSWMKIRN